MILDLTIIKAEGVSKSQQISTSQSKTSEEIADLFRGFKIYGINQMNPYQT